MANPAFDDEEYKRALATGHASAEDAGMGGSDEEFERARRDFESEFSESFTAEDGRQRKQEYDNSHVNRGSGFVPGDDVVDADYEDVGHPSTTEDSSDSVSLDDLEDEVVEPLRRKTRDQIDSYVDQVNLWTSGPDFVNDADRVDSVKAERLRLAAAIAEEPELISDPRLQAVAEYFSADVAYNSRPDPASLEYGEFVRNRARLRDEIFQGRSLETAQDYVTFALRTQHMILEPDPSDQHVKDQYDLIDLRREAVQAHYDDPRFIAEVARHRAGMLDELLVDIDRRDLLLSGMDEQTRARSQAMGDIFSEAVATVAGAGRKEPISSKVSMFQDLREVGRNIRHNHRAIVNFAGDYAEDSRGYEIGMAALEDVTWSDSMYKSWVGDLSPKERRVINKTNGVAGAFMVAKDRFEREFDANSPKAAESFAVMEQAAGRLLSHPDMQSRLSDLGGLDAISALHMFSPNFKGRRAARTTDSIEADILGRMGDSVISEGDRKGRLDDAAEAGGENYILDLTSGRVTLPGKINVNTMSAVEGLAASLDPQGDRSGTVLALARLQAVGRRDKTLLEAIDRASEDFSGKSESEKKTNLAMIGKYAAQRGPEYEALGELLSGDFDGMGQKEFAAKIAEGVENSGDMELKRLGVAMRSHGDMSGLKREIGLAMSESDPTYEVIDGSHLRIANNRKDLEAGKGVVLRLDGIVAPPPGTQTKSGNFDAGADAKAHLEEVIHRHGIGSLGFELRTLGTGENVVKAKLSSGEDLSQRMLRDGFAQPTKDSPESDRRESMARQAQAHSRGLWAEGFPDMDQSWRREKNLPEMTWRDKRLNLTTTVAEAMAGSNSDVFRRLGVSKRPSAYGMLTRTEQKLFALPLDSWSGNKSLDNQVRKVVSSDPERVMSMYNNNQEILADLRKRKDKLSQDEKVAHDRLTLGSRALGKALVDKNHLDPKDFVKNDGDLMSRRGLDITKNGVRVVTGSIDLAAQGAEFVAKHGAKKAGSALTSIMDFADSMGR